MAMPSIAVKEHGRLPRQSPPIIFSVSKMRKFIDFNVLHWAAIKLFCKNSNALPQTLKSAALQPMAVPELWGQV